MVTRRTKQRAETARTARTVCSMTIGTRLICAGVQPDQWRLPTACRPNARSSMGRPTSGSNQRPEAPYIALHGPSPVAVLSPEVGQRAAPAAPLQPPWWPMPRTRRRAVVQRAFVLRPGTRRH